MGIRTRIRFGTIKHDATNLTEDENKVLYKNLTRVAAHVARRLQPEWPVEVIPVDLPVGLTVYVGETDWVEGYELITQAVDAVAIAGPYSDALKEDFQPQLFAECFLEDPKRVVELYVERRRRTDRR